MKVWVVYGYDYDLKNPFVIRAFTNEKEAKECQEYMNSHPVDSEIYWVDSVDLIGINKLKEIIV